MALLFPFFRLMKDRVTCFRLERIVGSFLRLMVLFCKEVINQRSQLPGQINVKHSIPLIYSLSIYIERLLP